MHLILDSHNIKGYTNRFEKKVIKNEIIFYRWSSNNSEVAIVLFSPMEHNVAYINEALTTTIEW